MATLNLPTDVRTACWRLLKAQVQADTTYPAAGIDLVFFDGSRDAARDLADFDRPCLRFYPALGPMKWFDEGSQENALIVLVEAILTTPDCEDVLNLQGALESTLDTVSNLALQSSLVNDGAVTGLILFAQPLNPSRSQPSKDGVIRLTGNLVVEVRRPLS
jgi:hypothetical protein